MENNSGVEFRDKAYEEVERLVAWANYKHALVREIV